MLIRKILRVILYTYLIFIGFLPAQTESLLIIWNNNPEPSLAYYQLYRAINSINNLVINQNIPAPDTLALDDDNIQPGNLYAYSLVAVDTNNISSNFSDTVSVGIPQINWSLVTINNYETTYVDLPNILSDPDDSIANLNISTISLNHLQINTAQNQLLLIPDPINYTGSASFTFKVSDPLNLYDQKDINLIVEENPASQINNLQDNTIPVLYFLSQNYPNPFNPITTIQFGIPKSGIVKISLFNAIGEHVKTILHDYFTAGYHSITLDASTLESGIYFYQLQFLKNFVVKKMIYLK